MRTRRASEFDADQTASLLAELAQRLRARGASAAVFVVGGAAIAATGIREGRLTRDVDALTRREVVVEEARAMAVARGLPANWLNANAGMWMPPLPAACSMRPPNRDCHVRGGGLPVRHEAHRPACQGRRRPPRLGVTPGVGHRIAAQLEAHIRRYYTDPAMLEFILSGADVGREISLLPRDTSRMLNRASRDVGAHGGPSSGPRRDGPQGPPNLDM